MTGTTKSAARTTACLAVALTFVFVGCGGQKFDKIPAKDVNAAQKAFAEQWGNKTMTAWEKGEWPQVGQEATREFRAGHNDDKRQRAAHKFVKGKVGAFKSMEFVEALRSVPPQHVVYRFRGDFERGEAEIRIVFDLEGKLNGHWIKPWRDEMK